MQPHREDDATPEEVEEFVRLLEDGFGIDINEICRRLVEEFVAGKKLYRWDPK